MADSQRFVIDNNVLISRLLLPGSMPGQAVRKAMAVGHLLVSDATLEELATVLSRSKFDRYITIRDRQEFLRMVGLVAEHIPIFRTVEVCAIRKTT
jgi:predicted nucleic acid-binding protein